MTRPAGEIDTHPLLRQKFIYQHGLAWFQHVRSPEAPARIYTAKPGHGKTVLMAYDACQQMRAGWVIGSNIAISDRETGQTAVHVQGWLDVARLAVLALENDFRIRFYIDELHQWCDARRMQDMAKWLLDFLALFRHFGISFGGSTQHIDQVDKRVRLLTDEIIVPRKFPILNGKHRQRFNVPLWFEDRYMGNPLATSGGGADDFDLDSTGLVWVPWWARGAFFTGELSITPEATGKDEAMAAEYESLYLRACAVCNGRALPSLADYIAARSAAGAERLSPPASL